jgi:hypothetical protein
VLSSQKRGSRRSIGQLSAALLLVGLLLYNPFLALVNHSDGLGYQALARHRATVGASEMQHFASGQRVDAQPDATVEEAFTELLAESKQSPRYLFPEETLPPRLEPTANLWFRPPPTA